MNLIDEYIDYVYCVKRYSPRTAELYRRALESFAKVSLDSDFTNDALIKALTTPVIRNWEVYMLDTERLSPKTVKLNISALSSFCKYLVRSGLINSNPAAQVPTPKVPKRLPEFYKRDSMQKYMEATAHYTDGSVLDMYKGCKPLTVCKDKSLSEEYKHVLFRIMISILYSTGVRRAELISLNISSVDFRRKVLRVTGKGDKTREIPLVASLCDEISVYLKVVEMMVTPERCPNDPLLVTASNQRIYPALVDKAVKTELGEADGILGRRSPHVLRHTLATELLEDGTDINTIKELLGHANLAATQVYTHNTIAQLKKVYANAHPRAKK